MTQERNNNRQKQEMSQCQIFEDERKKREYIYGEKNLKIFLEIQKVISEDEILRNNPAHLGLSRQELYDIYMLKTKRLNELYDINKFELIQMGGSIFAEQIGCSLHVGMFMTTLDLLCDEDQRKKFIEKSRNFEIIGCYAQTELGHGSDVQNLELQAIFDKNSQEFIMHSPTISSTKWWIGDLGKNANHVVTQAQIIVDGKRKALGTFIVPIRCMKSHLPLEGVEVGDIGPKYGYNTKDNGYLRFNQFRIPKENLLSKYMKISNEGKIIRVGNEKLSYGTMMKIRTLILNMSCKYLGQGLIICTRYSLIRKQFKGENKQERAVIEYQTQLNKIIPLVALGYAMSQCSQMVEEIIDENQLKMEKEDYSNLNAIHCLISGFKSLFTSSTLEGLEQLRNACGGHGYMQYSGFPSIIQEYSPTATYEGENTVLYLQTARYLMKMYNKVSKNKPLDEFTSYLKQYQGLLQTQLGADQNECLGSVENLEKMLALSAIVRIDQAAKKLMNAVMSKIDLKTAWDQKAGIMLVECAKAHTIFTCFSIFKQKIQNKAGPMQQQMTTLLQLFAVDRILERPQALFTTAYLSAQQFQLLRTNIKENLLLQIRPHLLTLVEGFNMLDNTLKSAIGMNNGKPYHNLMDWVTNHNFINSPKVTNNLIKHWISTPIPSPKL